MKSMTSARSESRIFRPLERGDLALIRAWHNTPAVREGTFAFPFPASVEAEEQWYARNVAAGDGRNAIFGILAEEGDDAIIGLVMLRQIDPISRSAWFGIFIGDGAMRGKGHARSATHAILAFGFDTLGLNRIALEVDCANARAIALYEQAGFRNEGVMRQSRFIRGRFIDVNLMAILAGERQNR